MTDGYWQIKHENSRGMAPGRPTRTRRGSGKEPTALERFLEERGIRVVLINNKSPDAEPQLRRGTANLTQEKAGMLACPAFSIFLTFYFQLWTCLVVVD